MVAELGALEAAAAPGATRAIRRPPALVLGPAILVTAAMLLPVGYLIWRTLGAGTEAWDLLASSSVSETLVRTVLLAAAVTGATITLGVPLAWLTVRTDLPFRRWWFVLSVLPLVIPSYVGAMLVVAALGPKGLLQQMLAGPFGVDRLPDIYGFPGALLTLSLLTYPYVLLSVRARLWMLDPALEEASRGLGHGAWKTFRRVTLPQLRPAISAGALLVALYTLSDFGAVSLLQFNSFTRVIFLQYESAFSRTLAASSSLVLVALALALLLIESRARGRAEGYRSAGGSSSRRNVIRLGRWKWPALAFAALVVAVALALPMSVLGYWVVRGAQEGEALRIAWGDVGNSLYVSTLAAGAAVLAALPVAILSIRYSSWLSSLFERVSYIGFALPGIVVALALVFFGARYASPVYQTLGLLVFAYVVLFLPVALGTLRASLQQVHPHVEEAARSLGRSRLQVFLTVTVPLVRAGIVASAAGVFLLTMKELPATLILSPIGFSTLATSTWSAASAAFFAQAAIPALVLIVVSSVPVALLTLRERA